MWVVDDVKRDMEQDSTDARYPDPGDVANPCVSTSVAGTEMTAVAPGAGSGCAAGQNTDRPLAVVNSSRAAIAATELPAASSRGPQAHRVPCWGITASTPPPTPLLAGSPTR